MCYSFYIIRKGLWSPNTWNLSLYSRSIGQGFQIHLPLSSDLLCCCPHMCGWTLVSRTKPVHAQPSPGFVYYFDHWKRHLDQHKGNFTWLTNPIKYTIKLRSSELKLGPSPCHLGWEMNRGQPFMVPRFGVCLHVNTLRPSFISALRYFKQRRPNDNNMDVYVPITHSAVFPSGLGLSKKKKRTKIFRYSGNPAYASSIPFP